MYWKYKAFKESVYGTFAVVNVLLLSCVLICAAYTSCILQADSSVSSEATHVNRRLAAWLKKGKNKSYMFNT